MVQSSSSIKWFMQLFGSAALQYMAPIKRFIAESCLKTVCLAVPRNDPSSHSLQYITEYLIWFYLILESTGNYFIDHKWSRNLDELSTICHSHIANTLNTYQMRTSGLGEMIINIMDQPLKANSQRNNIKWATKLKNIEVTGGPNTKYNHQLIQNVSKAGFKMGSKSQFFHVQPFFLCFRQCPYSL